MVKIYKNIYPVEIYLLQFCICNIQVSFKSVFRNWNFCLSLTTLFSVLSRKALLLLKKKRYQEQLLDKTENQISNMETMVSRQRLPQMCSMEQQQGRERLSFLFLTGSRSGVCSD